ncbi:aminotransferase class IV [Tepidibacter formicigenes]|jgi:4-amino-4-deoxychorismate lyase|uniref:4-amino-4-deoxychorismate lyase n=1 Tax=Tepidibacter formicigenes DSM 15518 TaxID=1123349 RepID=A0A1M6PHC7_9FIRM|nr:aminotransferase class IV [Tepidibacter formicigenes]SHK07314.1 4-amino-4-deoxychorismate lyase [Tepidibacter formicigenes DSM 15518]
MKDKASFKSYLTKFGIGVFETIKVHNGNAIFLDKHLDRMYNSIKELNISFRISKNVLKKEIINYIKDIKYKALRVTIFDEGYNFSLRDISYKVEDYKKGYNLKISPIKRGKSLIHKYKTTNYFENIYSKRYALNEGYDEALFINMKNKILEGAMTNIFFIKEKKVYTPKEDLYILPGIIRSEVINILNSLSVDVLEEEIDLKEISKFEFCFITNSLMDLMRVNCIENINYNKENDLFNIINLKLKEKYNEY